MKEKTLKVLSCIVFICLLIGSIHVCADVLERKDARRQYREFFESDVNYDVILMGTSHMMTNVFPQELWRMYGISSYNWGYANCTCAESYYLLQDIVKYTEPKLIVLDMYGFLSYENEGNGKYKHDKIEQ